MKTAYLKTETGIISISGTEAEIESISFVDEMKESQFNNLLSEAVLQLKAYFEGKLKWFDLPLAETGTDFQNEVWGLVREIPYGKTATYGGLAQKLGDANLSRAVGAANGKNPYLIIVPCHRVVGENNKLTGYAGGLEKKEWLLKHEGSFPTGQLSLVF